jgi:hypothetical protein
MLVEWSLHWVLQVMLPCDFSFIVLTFTTCFGLHGHLEVCRIFLFSYVWRILLRCFFALVSRGHTLHVSICAFPVLFSFVNFVSCLCVWLLAFSLLFVCSVPNTIKLHADGNITCKIHWTIQCNRMLKYSIMSDRLLWTSSQLSSVASG